MAAGDAKPKRTDERQVLESPLSATWRPAVRERAVLVGVGPGITESDLDELAALADSAGAEPVARLIQSRPEPDPATFIGKGRLDDLHDTIHGRAGNDRQAERLERRLLAKAEHLLDRPGHWRAVERLAAELLRQVEISGRQARHLYEECLRQEED